MAAAKQGLLAVLVCLYVAAVAGYVSSTGLTRDATRPRLPCKTITRMGAEGGVSFGELDGSEVRVGIIKTRWNKDIIDSLSSGVREALTESKVKESNIFTTEVPGAYELPLAARFLAMSQTVDAIVCLGCLVKGDTMHFEYIAQAVSSGLMSVGLQTSTPVIFGVLTTLDEEQAKIRSTGANNHGIQWGKSAVEMGLLRMSALGQSKGGGTAGLGFGLKVGEGEGRDGRKDPGKKRIGF